MSLKKTARLRRAKRARMKIRELQIASNGNGLPRLVVTKTPRHISVQVIVLEDPIAMTTRVIASASTLEKNIKSQCKYTGNTDAAKIVGKTIAERLKALETHSIKIAFDRSGYKYHGRIKALADAARETGLEF